jgi:hypothetical protein
MIVKKNALYVLIVLKKYSKRDGSTESFKEYVKMYTNTIYRRVLSDSIDDIRSLVNIALDF